MAVILMRGNRFSTRSSCSPFKRSSRDKAERFQSNLMRPVDGTDAGALGLTITYIHTLAIALCIYNVTILCDNYYSSSSLPRDPGLCRAASPSGPRKCSADSGSRRLSIETAGLPPNNTSISSNGRPFVSGYRSQMIGTHTKLTAMKKK